MNRRPLRLNRLEDRLAPAIATWDGGGANNLWSTPANWAGDVAQAGDDLEFEDGVAQRTAVNDFAAGTSFRRIAFRGLDYHLSGNAITLTNGIFASPLPPGTGSGPIINFGLTLAGSQTIDDVQAFSGHGITITGPIDLNGNTLTVNTSGRTTATFSGPISGAGGLIKDGPGSDAGRLMLSGNNTYSGPTTVESGTIECQSPTALGAAGPGNGTVVRSVATLRLSALGQTTLAEDLQLAGMGAGTSQSGALSVINDYDLTGSVTVSAFDFTIIRIDDFSSLTLSGGLAGGSATVTLQTIGLGTGVVAIPNGSTNSYSGAVQVNGGELRVDGNLASARLETLRGTLSGSGIVGPLRASFFSSGNDQFSFVRPGGFGPAATLTTGDLEVLGVIGNGGGVPFNNGGVIQIDLTPSGVDKVAVNGSVLLSNGYLFVFPGSGFVPHQGERFTIVENDGIDPVSGTFAGMPEGAVVGSFLGDNVMRITYRGGDGNDVQLYATPAVELQRFAVGAGAGGGPQVNVYAANGALLQSFFAYGTDFRGGVHVATGDVTGDGVPDVVTAPGSGGGPVIRVWDGFNGALVREFNAYDPGFRGGAFVAIADLDADGRFDIITGAGAGGGPHVKAFNGRTGAEMASFFAYDAAFRGGVSVAGVNGSNVPVIPVFGKIVTGAGPGGGPHVKVFNADTLSVFSNFFAFDLSFRGGVNVAILPNVLGDFGIVTAPGAGGGPDVRVFLSHGLGDVHRFNAYDVLFRGGVNVGVAHIGPSGEFAILTGAGPGGGPHAKAFLTSFAGPLSQILSFYAFDPAFMGGVFVG